MVGSCLEMFSSNTLVKQSKKIFFLDSLTYEEWINMLSQNVSNQL